MRGEVETATPSKLEAIILGESFDFQLTTYALFWKDINWKLLRDEVVIIGDIIFKNKKLWTH